MYCWWDLNGILRCHKRASPLTVKNIKIENTETYKEKTNSIIRTIKIKYKKKRRNTTKIRRNVARRTQSIEKKTNKKQDNNKRTIQKRQR